jgi:putative ABC transport system permease protein
MRVTLLLTRHLLQTIIRQRARTFVLWLALVMGLAVMVGLFSFVSSIDDSLKAREKAVGGLANLRVEAIAPSSLSPGLVTKLERLAGTLYAVPLTEQRATLSSRYGSVAVTAFGIDHSAGHLRSAMQRELHVATGRHHLGASGLSLSSSLARTLRVGRGGYVWLFAYQRSPAIHVASVVAVPRSLSDIVTLPRAEIERLRGAPGRPNLIYVRLRNGASLSAWRNRALAVLPANATITTPADEQHELDQVLNLTVRSSTTLFGAVTLVIVGLLIYVLQLMRMIERHEDAGLIRALGSSGRPLVAAEILVLALLLLAATAPGALLGYPIAHYLVGQMPSYVTNAFDFTVQLGVKIGTVAVAAALALAAGSAATVAALASTRAPVAQQLGRSPQAGATATASISLPAALALLVAGAAGFALGMLLTGSRAYPEAAVMILLGLGSGAFGLLGVLAHAVGRLSGKGWPPTLLVARSAIAASPRRAALSATIMALGIGAMIPPQLIAHGLDNRASRITGALQPDTLRVVASQDTSFSVPMSEQYARQALKEKVPRILPRRLAPAGGGRSAGTTHARLLRQAARRPLPGYAVPMAFNFVGYRGRRIELLALDARRAGYLYRSEEGLAAGLPKLRHDRGGVLISNALAAGTGLARGDHINLHTPSGMRSLEIIGKVEDNSWPSGTVYMDTALYRKLYHTDAANMIAVEKTSQLRTQKLDRLKPLRVISGKSLVGLTEREVNRSNQSLLAMRFLTLIAALVAVGGILATSILARRREWGVLRAMGMSSRGLLGALSLEVLLIMLVGAALGVLGGIATFEGPLRAFIEGQGFLIGGEVVVSTLLTVVSGAVVAGTLAILIPTWRTARVRLADALSYE